MTRTKIFAAYLPQYHVTEDNNKFWGDGFTDWIGVENATPQFEGHNQPRVPLNHNYYDLSDVSVIRAQAEMAKKYGVDGFNIYHYWFKDGKQELEKPAELLLNAQDIDISYFFSWDNCSWGRTWGNIKGNDWAPLFDKKYEEQNKSAILVPFEYGNEDQWKKHFDYLLPFFKDNRYYKIDNRPVFLFCTRFEEDTLFKMGIFWDKCAKEKGFNGLYLANKKKNLFTKPIFDTEFSYEPEASAWGKRRAIETRLNDWFHISLRRDEPVKYLYSYDIVWKKIIKSAKSNIKREIIGSIVRFDDTPRRGNDARIILGETPEKFKSYFSELYDICCKNDKQFMLLTAWNEWGEGAYIEPDEESGYAYLEALKEVVGNGNKNQN